MYWLTSWNITSLSSNFTCLISFTFLGKGTNSSILPSLDQIVPRLNYEVHTINFQTFFVWAFKIVVVSRKFSNLSLDPDYVSF